MNRLLSMSLLAAALALLVPAGADAADADADTMALDLGEVRGDTLYVARDRVITAALERNEMLAASGAMRDAASADALGAWRAFTPRVELGEFFLRSDDALSSFGFKLQNRGVTPADFNPALLNDPGETNNFITRLQLLQPVFNGGMGIAGKQAANAASRAAEYRHRRAAETVRYQAVQAYEGLVLARAYLEVMDAAVRSAESHVRQAEAMVAAEMATNADLLQARVYLSAIRQRQIEVRNMAAVAGEHIKLLTAVGTNLPIAAQTSLAEESGLSLPDSVDVAAVAERNDLLASREQADAAGKMVGVARGAVLPHINLSLQRDYYSHEDLFGTDAKSWTLGVYATLGFGLGDVGEIKKAKAQSRAAAYMADFASRQAQVEATQALLAVQAAYEKVLVARDAVGAAREGLRIVTNQYREGLASMVDLLDTQAAATMAEGNHVQALYDYSVGLANLEFSGAVPRHDADTEMDNATRAPAAE